MLRRMDDVENSNFVLFENYFEGTRTNEREIFWGGVDGDSVGRHFLGYWGQGRTVTVLLGDGSRPLCLSWANENERMFSGVIPIFFAN